MGASTWASGNQMWNGNIGILIENVINSNIQNRFCLLFDKLLVNNALKLVD